MSSTSVQVKQYRELHRKTGQCLYCPNYLTMHKSICEACILLKRDYVKKIREKRRANGQCLFCDNLLVEGSKTYCLAHKEAKSKANKNLSKEKKSKGLCSYCPEPLLPGSKWFCAKHWEKRQNKYVLFSYARKTIFGVDKVLRKDLKNLLTPLKVISKQLFLEFSQREKQLFEYRVLNLKLTSIEKFVKEYDLYEYEVRHMEKRVVQKYFNFIEKNNIDLKKIVVPKEQMEEMKPSKWLEEPTWYWVAND